MRQMEVAYQLAFQSHRVGTPQEEVTLRDVATSREEVPLKSHKNNTQHDPKLIVVSIFFSVIPI